MLFVDGDNHLLHRHGLKAQRRLFLESLRGEHDVVAVVLETLNQWVREALHDFEMNLGAILLMERLDERGQIIARHRVKGAHLERT